MWIFFLSYFLRKEKDLIKKDSRHGVKENLIVGNDVLCYCQIIGKNDFEVGVIFVGSFGKGFFCHDKGDLEDLAQRTKMVEMVAFRAVDKAGSRTCIHISATLPHYFFIWYVATIGLRFALACSCRAFS